MSNYVPLSVLRHQTVPAACQSCTWWQTTGSEHCPPETALEKRRRWIASLEDSWGSPGLLLQAGKLETATPSLDPAPDFPANPPPVPAIVASITFAPPAAVPRMRDLPFGSLPAGSVLLCCLRSEGEQPKFQPRRLMHKALGQLKARGVKEVYAVADHKSAGHDQVRCRFFSVDALATNGFSQVTQDGRLVLMRVELRGLLSLIGDVQTVVRRVLRDEPTPSPAAWTRREAQ